MNSAAPSRRSNPTIRRTDSSSIEERSRSEADVATELLGDALLFAPLQLQQDVFLGGEVKEEGAVRDARGCHDGADVSRGEPGSLELGDGGAHQPFASLKTLRFAR